MISNLSANLSATTYQDMTRWAYVGVAALFGAIGVSSAFLSDPATPWIGGVAVLTTALVIAVALRWPHRSQLPLLEVGLLLAIVGWITAAWVGASPATGLALFLPPAFGIATRRPWWPWAVSALFALVVAPVIAGAAGVLPDDDWLSNHLIAISLLGAQIAVFLGIELGWMIFTRIDAHRADENELSLTRERLRFANELHDVQGHTLLAIKLKAELARRSLDRNLDTTRTELAEIERLVSEASAQTRQIANGYRTVSLATELANAEQLLGAAGIKTEIEQPQVALGSWELLIATATREAVSNVLRHASPSFFTLRFTGSAMIVSNDGSGTDKDTSSGGGNGLLSLHERFAEHGGSLTWMLDGDVFTLIASRSVEGGIA